MSRFTSKGLAALALVGIVFSASQAQAFHHHRGWGSSGGSYGSWGSSGGSWGYGSWGSSGGSWGGYRGWGSSGGSWGSSGGSWGSSGGYGYGSSGGSWGSSGGSWGSSGGTTTNYGTAPAAPATPSTAPMTPVPPAPGTPAPAAPAPSEPAPTNSTYHPTYGPLRTSALLSVKVPADAKVFVNDRPTTSAGTDREFISRDLQEGARYNYDIRAEFVRDGQPVTELRTIQMVAGQAANLDFTAQPSVQTAAAGEPRTTLIVHVPADAKLYLADRETQSTGETREFSTTKLPAGSEWATYRVRAVVERDGRELVREETVSLKAGESRDLTLNFADGEKVASKTDR